MILIAIGANLPGCAGTPRDNCEAALVALGMSGVRVTKRSRWYRTPPWPPSDQPWYVNGVVAVETSLGPAELLAVMHRVEREFGRVREPSTANAPRPLDLDLIDYEGQILSGSPPVLPHPRLESRAFVLRPLADVAPQWRHPVTGRSVTELLADLPSDAVAEPIP